MYGCPAGEGVTDMARDPSPRLHDEDLAMVQLLERSPGDRGAAAVTPMAFQPDMTDEDVALVQARRTLQFIYAARDCFPAMRELADHPGWEMMLHLFIASREGKSINTLDLCTQTGTWRPLAVRYIEMLFERGLVEREVSADEKPDCWAIRLEPAAQERLQELLCGFARNAAAREEKSAAN